MKSSYGMTDRVCIHEEGPVRIVRSANGSSDPFERGADSVF